MKIKLICLCLLCLSFRSGAIELEKLVPGPADLGQFEFTEAPMYYTPDNLWDYINGAAPAYLAYGFQRVVTFILRNTIDSTEYVADIYEMADSLNAFGIYSSEKAPEAPPIHFASGGFKAGNTLYFWQANYYVKLIAYDETPDTPEVLNQLGKVVSKKLPVSGRLPHRFSIFPQQAQLKASARYIARDVLGQKYLKNGYRLDYVNGSQKYQILLIENSDSVRATDNFQKYYDFLKETGKILSPELPVGEQSFWGKDSYYGNILFTRSRSLILAVLGCENREMAINIVKGMLQRMKKKS